MELNKQHVIELMHENNWSQNKLAVKAGVSKTTISRWINGKRGAGVQLISGIIKAFPEESISELFFFSSVTK